MNCTLQLPPSQRGARLAVTSLPWPATRREQPRASGAATQVVPLFAPHLPPRRCRHLLLSLAAEGETLPETLALDGTPAGAAEGAPPFSDLRLVTLRECLQKGGYVYREEEARLTVNGREIGLRLGLMPAAGSFSWWQWAGAERLWAGPLAEAWRVGGSLVPYPADRTTDWANHGLQAMGERIQKECGDVLHGDLFLIVWRTGCIQATAHFRAGYFHQWPRPVPAFPVLLLRDLQGTWDAAQLGGEKLRLTGGGPDTLDLSPSRLMFSAAAPAQLRPHEDGVLLQPWSDLRVLASKSKDNVLTWLDPQRPEVLPAGVSRSFTFNLGVDGADTQVARYQVPAAWYRECGEIDTDRPGPAAAMAQRSATLIRDYSLKGGFDTGAVWRYLRRDLRTGKPEEDGAEWEGDLAQAMFQLAYQTGEDPALHGELYRHHAYHAADVAVYHGSWMERLEISSAFTAPLPKARISGILFGYLETGDPYLLEIARSVAAVYMAMEWSRQPRSCMGRDAYPVKSLLALWDYTAEPLYLDFCRQTIRRLLATQMPDGGFSGQAGAGTMSGTSCLPAQESISFGSGLLAPVAIFEWARRDSDWPADLRERWQRWRDLILRLQPEDGVWLNRWPDGQPYPLIGAGALFSLCEAGRWLDDPRCRQAVKRYLDTMNARQDCITGTHAFLAAQYAHVADAALQN